MTDPFCIFPRAPRRRDGVYRVSPATALVLALGHVEALEPFLDEQLFMRVRLAPQTRRLQ